MPAEKPGNADNPIEVAGPRPDSVSRGQTAAEAAKQDRLKGMPMELEPAGPRPQAGQSRELTAEPKPDGGTDRSKLEKEIKQLQEQAAKHKAGLQNPGSGDFWKDGKQMFMAAAKAAATQAQFGHQIKNKQKQLRKLDAGDDFRTAQGRAAQSGSSLTQELHGVIKERFKREHGGKEPTRKQLKQAVRQWTKDFVPKGKQGLKDSQKEAIRLKDSDFAQQQAGTDKDGDPLFEYTSQVDMGSDRQAASDDVLNGLEAGAYSAPPKPQPQSDHAVKPAAADHASTTGDRTASHQQLLEHGAAPQHGAHEDHDAAATRTRGMTPTD